MTDMATLGSAGTPPLLYGAGLLLFSCTGSPGDKDDTAPSESDTVDTPDTAETAETSETATPPPYTGLSGSILIQSTVEGTPLCDADVVLTGTGYTGGCDGCTFGFDMSGSLVREGGDPSCVLPPTLSFIPVAGVDHLRLFFWEELGPFTHYLQAYYQGYSYDGGGPYPYYRELASDGNPYASASLDGDNFVFWWEYAGWQTYDDNPFYQWCPWPQTSTAPTAYVDGAVALSSLPCAEYQRSPFHDVWSITVTEPSTLRISVDMIAADTAMDARFWVNDPGGCTVLAADDNFECSFPPPYFACPSAELTAATPGVWQIEVMPYLSCAGSTGAYQLTVEGGSDLTLVEAAGAVSWSDGRRAITTSAAMTATLTPR